MADSVVEEFYTAFERHDGEGMAVCYADDIVFEDPAFGELHAPDAGDMWRMLCGNATDLQVEHQILEQSPTSARTNWIAIYTFSTGRAVRNDVTATMQLREGRIVDHRDDFNFWQWSSQALGLPGRLLGWSPFLRSKVRGTARDNLRAFQEKRAL